MNCLFTTRALARTPAWQVILCSFALRCEIGTAEVVAPLAAASSPATAGVLVLQDGGVLTGTFMRSGDRFVLTRGGTELQIAASRVLVACRSLEEAYDKRRQLIQRPSADSHLALGAWCLRHNLLPQAARELLDARGLEPENRGVALLQRRLATAGSPRPPRNPLKDPHVAPAAHVATEPNEADAQQPALAIEDLPPGAIEQFTRRVQPILVNSCTLSGCHQPGGKQGFQLDRALLRGMANRRSTRQNLAQTLALVDREQPHLSRLLTVPRQSHGGMRAPVFGPRQSTAYAHVVDWVALVTNSDSPQEEPKSTPADETTAVAQPASVDPLPKVVPGRQAAGRKIRLGAQLQSWQPKDPFDPEIFNRQQHARTMPAAEGASSPTEGN